jgi:hypothetical protein
LKSLKNKKEQIEIQTAYDEKAKIFFPRPMHKKTIY